MPNDYAVYLKSPTGTLLTVLDRFSLLDLTWGVNQVGRLRVDLPYGAYSGFVFQPEGILEVWRSINGAPPYLVGNKQYLMRIQDKTVPTSGVKTLTLTGIDQNVVLARKIIAHVTGSAQALLSGACDDLCKSVVKNEMGSGATDFFGSAAARDISAYLTVDANLGLGPSTQHAISQRNVLLALQDICNIAPLAPSNAQYLAFDITSTVPASGIAWILQTFIGQRGQDHRFPGGSAPIILSPDSGAISEIQETYDYENVFNFYYVGGQGVGAGRTYASASDAASIGLGPFGRVENFIPSVNSNNTTVLQLEGSQGLRQNRARRTFIARYSDTPGQIYGQHFKEGDYLTIWFDDTLDARVDGLNIRVEAGEEKITLAFRTDS